MSAFDCLEVPVSVEDVRDGATETDRDVVLISDVVPSESLSGSASSAEDVREAELASRVSSACNVGFGMSSTTFAFFLPLPLGERPRGIASYWCRNHAMSCLSTTSVGHCNGEKLGSDGEQTNRF